MVAADITGLLATAEIMEKKKTQDGKPTSVLVHLNPYVILWSSFAALSVNYGLSMMNIGIWNL